MALITLLNIYKHVRSEVLMWQTESQSSGEVMQCSFTGRYHTMWQQNETLPNITSNITQSILFTEVLADTLL